MFGKYLESKIKKTNSPWLKKCSDIVLNHEVMDIEKIVNRKKIFFPLESSESDFHQQKFTIFLTSKNFRRNFSQKVIVC